MSVEDAIEKKLSLASESMRVDELRNPAGAVRIGNTEDRAITLPQLDQILKYVSDHCRKQTWTSSNPCSLKQKLEPDALNLYDLVFWVIKPSTKGDQCSYVELVATGPQLPVWFVSHWWGEPVKRFVHCLKQHTQDRRLRGGTPYWVCAYANNQWQLSGAVSADPAESSFRKAIDKSMGTVTIFDEGAITYSRVWCAYEIFVSLSAPARKTAPRLPDQEYLYDAYMCRKSFYSVGLTDGDAEIDKRGGNDPLVACTYRAAREAKFPPELCVKALNFDVKRAEASVEADRRHILNAIAGVSHLDAEPLENHTEYERVNRLLRGRLASGAFAQAVAFKIPDLAKIGNAMRDSGLERLELRFTNADDPFTPLANALPSTLKDLFLDFSGSGPSLAGDGCLAFIPAIAKLQKLQSLRLIMTGPDCKKILSPGVGKALGSALGELPMLQFLTLWVSTADFGNEGLCEIAAGIGRMQRIERLELTVGDCNFGSPAAEMLGSSLSALTMLKRVRLIMDENHIGDDGARKLIAGCTANQSLCEAEIVLSHNGISDQCEAALQELVSEAWRLTF
jgi:hypothetical protein